VKILCLGVSVINQIGMKGRRLLSQYTFGNLLFFETGYLSVQRSVCLCAWLSFYSGHGLEFSSVLCVRVACCSLPTQNLIQRVALVISPGGDCQTVKLISDLNVPSKSVMYKALTPRPHAP